MNSLPLWVADRSFRTVFLSRRMREQFGISFEQVMDGVSLADMTPSGVQIDPPSVTGLRAASWQLRHSDGTFKQTTSYYRPLHFNGIHYGYVGSTRLQDCWSGAMAPAPLRELPAYRSPHLSIDLPGTALDMVSMYIRALGPLVSLRSVEDCLDLDGFRRELIDLHSLSLAINVLRPSQEFFGSAIAFPDFNFQLVSELHAIEAIQAHYFNKPFRLESEVIGASAMDMRFWCEKYGLIYGEVDTSVRTPLEKMRFYDVDAHLTSNPEDWAEALFAGVPCFLMERPWTRWIRSPWRVRSVESMLTTCGVEIDRTFCAYDPELMAKAS